jgi:hypothetical protein
MKNFLRYIFPIALMGLTSFCSSSILYAQESSTDPKTIPWYEAITVNTFMSSGYSYNFNKPDTGKNQFRVFDVEDNTFKVDVVEFSVKKDAHGAGDAGFRFDLTAGSSIPKVARSGGLDIGDLDFHQMFVSYIAPFGTGLKLDFGKFITSMGYEVIEGYDGYNDNYSRSFLFGYAIPFTHTGIRAGYTFNENISAMLMIVNGWDNAIDNNKSKSVCGQLTAIPISGLNLYANYMFGPEKEKNNSDNRSVFDFVGTYSINNLATVGLNTDYGVEENSANNGESATWKGVAGYIRLNLAKDFSLVVRGEQFDDKNGLRTGVAQKLQEITLTPEFRPTEHFIIRGDLRFDKSDREVFQKKAEWQKTQTTISLNFLYAF